MKKFVRISMLTWDTAATRANDGVDGYSFEPALDPPRSGAADCSVRSDLDWIREHEGFDESIVRLSVRHT